MNYGSRMAFLLKGPWIALFEPIDTITNQFES